MTNVAAVSDTHGMLTPDLIPDCDVLIIAGDFCPNKHYHANGHNVRDAYFQLDWLESQFLPMLSKANADQIVICGGNHDWLLYENETRHRAEELFRITNIVYLNDQSWEYKGLKFYASPHQPWFHDWAYNFPENDHWNGYKVAKATWAKIPNDTNILVTHTPPLGILDKTMEGMKVGCPMLRDRIAQLKISHSFFGHIHECYGQMQLRGTTYVNCSFVTRQMIPNNPIQTFEV